MEQVGTVVQVWRYPVKSMGGEMVERLELASGGAIGDRTLAVVDRAAQKVLSGKRWPQLMLAAARVDESRGTVVITLPDGSEHSASDPSVHEALSAWLDHEVRLEPPPADGVFPMEMYTGMSDEDTPVFDWPGPPGTWLDLADAHWLTDASLRAAAKLHSAGDWDVRRFRPTALIAADGHDFVEDLWGKVDVGGVGTDVLMQTPRCSMPSRPQPGLVKDKAIGTTLRDQHANNLGLYATVTRPGTVAVGDTVNAS